jgi:hypothetical protein
LSVNKKDLTPIVYLKNKNLSRKIITAIATIKRAERIIRTPQG